MRALLGLLAGLAALGSVEAAPLIYNENPSGDLSSSGNAPTLLNFDIGVNSVSGTMGRTGSVVDSDIFTFTVEAGEVLTSLFLVSANPAENSFFAIGAGSTISTNATNPFEDGSSHMSNLMTLGRTGEFLGELAAARVYGSGPSTVTDPLGPGTYTIWFQETTTTVNYELQFTIASVPEPASLSLVALGGVLFFGAARRVRRRTEA